MTVADLLQGLSSAVPVTWHGPALAAVETPCPGIVADSRKVVPGAIFVAVKGQQTDGAAFASEAVGQGVAAVVAQVPPSGTSPVPWLVVGDAHEALARLSCTIAGDPSHELSVVGITGTNGKTTTSYLVHAIFEAAGVPCGILGTVSYQIGATVQPATHTTPEAPELQQLLRQMVEASCRACVMEVSSHALALRRADFTRFAGAVFTNLTRDHLDFHADMESYFAAKRRLFEMLPADAPAAINADDPRGEALVRVVGRPVTYALTRDADVRAENVASSLEGLRFDIRTRHGIVHVRSQLLGRPNVYNILAAVAVTSELGIPIEAIERGLAALVGVPGRFEVVSTPADDVSVIVDYAHTDDALRNLLETARPLAARRLITVCGAGGDRDKTKRPLMGMVAARLSDVVVITSDNPRTEDPVRIMEEVRRGADAETRQRHGQVLSVVDRREAIARALRLAASGDLVLVAGKGHERYQEIGGKRIPFDDVAVARELLEARRRTFRAG